MKFIRLPRTRGDIARPPLTLAAAGCSYEAHLADKVKSAWAQLGGLLDDVPTQVFPSAPAAFRYKCGFGVLRGAGTSVAYSMPEPHSGRPTAVDGSLFLVSSEISRMMWRLLGPLNAAHASVRRGLCTFTFFSSRGGAAHSKSAHGLVALGYNRPLGEAWLRDFATAAAPTIGAIIVGRAPHGERLVSTPAGWDGGAPDHLVQWFEVDGHSYPQIRRDGIFVQANVPVCEEMLRWATAQARVDCAGRGRGLGRLMLEPYCGNGSFTLPLSRLYAAVLASDSCADAVVAARACADAVGITNVEITHSDAAAACEAARATQQLERGLVTVLLNPPRDGACAAVLRASALAARVMYFSCNPKTLLRDLGVLTRTHQVRTVALFDQFAWSSHAEVGVVLERIGAGYI